MVYIKYLYLSLFLLALSFSAHGNFDLDIDDDGKTEALTDGLLIIRYLFGFTGSSLTEGATASYAQRTSPDEISSYLDSNKAVLDVDGDGSSDALSDGVLIIRYLFGFSGSTLIDGAVSLNAERTSFSDVDAYLNPMVIINPSQFTVATQRLLAEKFNKPQVNPRQWSVFSLDVSREIKDRYQETMTALIRSFGGYMNWNYMVFNEEGTDVENQPVMERLIELKYNGWEDGYTTEELKEVSSCLGGAAPNGYERDSDYESHSTCMVWKGFLLKSHGLFDSNYQPEQWLVSLEAMAQSLQHEYFHHYQRAHALDRGLDYQADRENPENTVNAPWWWIEGAAMASEMWWLRGNWSKLSYLKDEPRVGEYIESRLEDDKKSFWFNLQRIQKRPPILEPNGYLNYELDDCYDWKLSQVHSDGYPDTYNEGGCEFAMAPFAPIRFMAHKSSWKAVLRDIPADYFEHGFWGALEIHTGLNEQEFYNEFNQFMRSTSWDSIEEDFAPEGWNTPSDEIESIVEFLEIDRFGK